MPVVEPQQRTLSNFYAIHTAILAGLILMLLPFHFWRVRKTGGLVILHTPDEAPERKLALMDDEALIRRTAIENLHVSELNHRADIRIYPTKVNLAMLLNRQGKNDKAK